MNTNTATTFEADTVKTVTFAGAEMTLGKALAIMRAGGWDQTRIDAWTKRHAPKEANPEAPAIEATETAPEAATLASEAEPMQEQAEAPAMPVEWQARALALKQTESQETVTGKTVTGKTDTVKTVTAKMKTGDWFTIELCYSDRLRLTIGEPTGSARGIFGVPGASVPVFYAYDENGARHEVCEHDIDRPGIGGLIALDGVEPSTEAERAALAEKGERAKEQARIERENTERERTEERAALPAKYPMLKTVTDSGKNGAVLGAANIKRELKAAFPGVAFSVRARHYTSIDISWNDGPTTNQVETITAKYERGSFDGMTDSYTFDHSNVFPDVFGGAQYVFNNRHMTVDGMRRAWQLAGYDPAEVRVDEHGNWDNWKDEEYTRRAMSNAYDETDLREQAEAKPQETDTPETDTVKSDTPETAEGSEAMNTETNAQETVTASDTKADEAPMLDAIDSAIIDAGLFSDGNGETFLTGELTTEECDALRRLVWEMADHSYTGPNEKGFMFAARGLAAMGKDAAYALLQAWVTANFEPKDQNDGGKTDTQETVTGCEQAPVCPVDDAACDGCAGVRESCEDASTQETVTDKQEAKHTPGPWSFYYQSVDPDWAIITDGNGNIVANVNAETCTDIPPCVSVKMPKYANARLIASAPELLEALRECVSVYETHRDAQPTGHLWPDPNHIHHARQAIAKATGQAFTY